MVPVCDLAASGPYDEHMQVPALFFFFFFFFWSDVWRKILSATPMFEHCPGIITPSAPLCFGQEELFFAADASPEAQALSGRHYQA